MSIACSWTLPDSEDIAASDILVLKGTSREHVALARRAAGLVVVEGGMDSHAAQMAIELGLTVIVGAEDAFSALEEGQEVTLDAVSGRVYEGAARAHSPFSEQVKKC